MATYLLNSAVLTGFGDFTYRSIDADEARKALAGGFTSAIGHPGTAKFCAHLLQLDVPFNRTEVSMQPGDVAVVVRLKGRLPEAQVLTEDAFHQIGYEVGLLSRVALVDGTPATVGLSDQASPGLIGWRTRVTGVVRFLWAERRTFLLFAVLLSLASLLTTVLTTGNWTNWQTWDIVLTLATFLIGLTVFLGESIEDWEERLPKRVTVFFRAQGRTRMVCYLAHLAHEGDIRNWGQQIGLQMCSKSPLDLSPFLDVRRIGVRQTADATFTYFEAVIYLRSLPEVLEDEFAREATAQSVSQDSLCKVLRADGQGKEKITFENLASHPCNGC